MLKRRPTLSPESVYARHKVEEWLTEELGVLAEHRRRIWKVLPNETLNIRKVPDLPESVYDKFDDKFKLTTTRVVEEKASEHGAKLVIETQDGHFIETVLIHHDSSTRKRRTTVCVSSQVGCQMGCTFCATGTMGLSGNLTAAEIVEQVHHARVRYPAVTRVVFMGQGEPLDNYENVKEAIGSLAEPHAFAIPLSRITLSTVGVTHAIRRLARECPEIQLALSLHAPNDEIRRQIVPSTKAFSVTKIMDAVSEYQCNNTRSVMIEYIMIDKINSSPECAHQLGRLLQGRNCMVNLIPYNPTDAGDRLDYRSPSHQTISAFQDIIFRYHSHSNNDANNNNNKPIRCTVRWSTAKGQDLDAACGQLVLKNFQKSQQSNGDCNSDDKTTTSGGDIEDLGGGGRKSNKTANTGKRTAAKKSNDSDSKACSNFTRLNHHHWYILCATGVVLTSSAMLLRMRKR